MTTSATTTRSAPGKIVMPLFIEDLPALRVKLERAERDGSRMGQVWSSVRRRAQSAPLAYPWFTPLVAMVTQTPSDIEAAKRSIRDYVSTFDGQALGMGLQFHFWCFAFPHARWSLYFQWLDSLGAWEPDEARSLREKLITFQFVNFFYGMRTKPEPECVDNQTMSLCFSNALFGELFGKGPDASPTAIRMATDGLRRLPSMLGGVPASGYSGEGSTYMDHVVGPCVPFLVELLERAHGGDWFDRELPPYHCSARAILQMVAREWMPGGLLLPWDHYGYGLPTRSAIAYAAHRTGDATYHDMLDHHADWGHDISIGWGFDDLPWALLWWPEKRSLSKGKSFASWAHHDVGAALIADDASLYLFQHWDESTPHFPTRAHVNPNAVTLSAFDSPLTVDGVPGPSCKAFEYPDTWRVRNGVDFNAIRTNFGSGCAGAHSVLLVDAMQGMHVKGDFTQARMTHFDPGERSVVADVTPQYREHWPDTRQVLRKSRLIDNKFWLIEDLAQFDQPHRVTARWWLRPQQLASPQISGAQPGITIQTAEGVTLMLQPVLGPGEPDVTLVQGYPAALEERSLCVDFHQTGSTVRWLWLAIPLQSRRIIQTIDTAWAVLPDADETLEFTRAKELLQNTQSNVPMTMPAFSLASLPVVRRWWYRKTLRVEPGNHWLRLPRNLINSALWIDGRPQNTDAIATLGRLMQPQIPFHVAKAQDVEFILRTDCSASQYGPHGKKHDTHSFWGTPALLAPSELPSARVQWIGRSLRVSIGEKTWDIDHTELPASQ